MQCGCTVWTTIRIERLNFLTNLGHFGRGSVLTFTKMRESEIKSPGLVAYPKILKNLQPIVECSQMN